MATNVPANRILQHLRDLIRRRGGGGVGDGLLLERFVRERDETAFEVLVWRHGPMVLALGQRLLRNAHDAEDVLQATFLTLVRKAGSISKRESLGSWLYKVAYRLALRIQARAVRMRADGSAIEDVPATDESAETDWRELRPLLDGAIERLPEKYRTAVILCDLQGKSYREVAEQLGCPIGTVSTRLTRARQLLRKRLAHQGIAVPLVALTAALTRQTATAMPASLTACTVRAALLMQQTGGALGSLSAPVAELLQGEQPIMLWTRFKIGTLLALGIGVLAVSAAVMARRESPAPTDTPRAEATKEKADKPATNGVRVRGQVLDPDGKPIANARLHWPRVPAKEPQSEDDIEVPQRGKTDAEGRFQFELPRSDIKPEYNLALIAVADGYGVAWAFWSDIKDGKDLTLRLVKDQPIEGRIVNTEGKAQAGVKVSILTLNAPKDGKLDTFVTAWKREWRTAMSQAERMFLPLGKVIPPVTTDKDGHFRVTGAGAQRLVVLRVKGAEVTQDSLHVINQGGFDAAATNKAALDRIPAELRFPGQPPQLYGPKLTYVVPAGRRIEGTVREMGTGKPVAGFRIHIGIGYGDGLVAISDKDGRYHFRSVSKRKEYLFSADPPANTTWLMSGARVRDSEGVQPLTVDFTVAHGIVLSGRVIDKITGKGVRGSIRFVPLPGNKFADQPGYDSFKFERMSRTVDSQGRFKFSIIPGPGVLLVQVDGGEKANGGQVNPYKSAALDAKDRALVKINESEGYFTAVDNTIEFLGLSHAVKVVDFVPEAATAECDLFLERGQTMTVRIADADGKALKGTTVAGITAGWPGAMPIKDSSCTVFALDPKKPRSMLFYHGERNLAGSLLVRGDEKEPPVVKLAPTGSVTGRVLDRDGQPIAGADIQLSSPERSASELYRQLDQKRKPIHTDKEGRFRIPGIVPEVKFNLNIYQGKTFLVGEPRIGVRQVKSGETLDLGDVRTKPQ